MQSLNNILRIKQQPYNLFLIAALLLVLVSFLSKSEHTFDLHIHDTYFVVAFDHFLGLLAIIPCSIWVIYWLTKNMLYSSKLTWIHSTTTIFMLLLLVFSPFGNVEPRRYYDYSEWGSLKSFLSYNSIISILFSVLFTVQVLFVINIGVGFIKKIARK